MEKSFKVIESLNNNAVLVQKPDKSQIVLLSKGIGFGKKTGDLVVETAKNGKVFCILDNSRNENKLRQLSLEEEKVEQATREILEMAQEKLNLKNDKLYDALLDHITFAIECLQMGLPIENPFLGEISILYREEYETAKIAAQMIQKRLGVEIGEEETGFIALHLYSARQHKHIRSAVKSTRVYNDILGMVSRCSGKNFDVSSPAVASFFLSLNQLIQNASEEGKLCMEIKNQVRNRIRQDWGIAQKIAKFVNQELGVFLSDDIIAFIAVDIHKLVQM